MGVRIRAPLRSDAVRDTMEDAVAGPDAGAMLENAMSWSTASRTAVAEGRSLDRHVQDVHTLTVAETFTDKDNTTLHWPDGSCYSRKKECSKNKMKKN